MTEPTEHLTRRIKALVDPIHLVAYEADEPNAALHALGLRDNYWDGYFAGRAAPLGLAPAEVVDAVLYNFAPGEVARHIPRVWHHTTPEAAVDARAQGCADALRRLLGEVADRPEVIRAADLALRAAAGAPNEARPLFAGLRSLPVPTDPVARLWHAATLLREYRGDCHNIALAAAGIGGSECHVLMSLAHDIPAREFGRLSHLPDRQLDAILGGLRRRGLIDDAEQFTAAGRRTRDEVEDVTDRLDAAAYDHLEPGAVQQLITDLTPIADALGPARII